MAASSILIFLLAGCAGAAPESGQLVPTGSIDAGQGVGKIIGLVLTSEQLPIEGVTIRILPKSNPQGNVVTVSTDEGGKFEVIGLEPGVYTVYATMEAFKDLLPLNVDVVGGAASNIVVTMQEARVLKPFHESFSRVVTFPANACIIAPVDTPDDCTGAFDPSNLTTPFPNDEELNGPLQDLIVEATWSPTAPMCAEGFQHHVFSPEQQDLDLTYVGGNEAFWNDTNPYHWDNVPDATTNPTYLRIQREGDPLAMFSQERNALNGGKPIAVVGEWKIQTWPLEQEGAAGTPVDFSCHVNQSAEVWVTAFYVAPAPAEWTVFDGN